MATALAFSGAAAADDFFFMDSDVEALLFCDSLAGAVGEGGGSSEMEAFGGGWLASSSSLAAEGRGEPDIADHATRWA